MRLIGEGDSVLVVNDRLRLSGIPADKESGITNDPNAWFADEAAFIVAVRRIVHLSVETARIVDGLPPALEG